MGIFALKPIRRQETNIKLCKYRTCKLITADKRNIEETESTTFTLEELIMFIRRQVENELEDINLIVKIFQIL